MNNKFICGLFILIMLCVSGCSFPLLLRPTTTPVFTNTPSPTKTPTPIPSPTQTPTQTLTPTPIAMNKQDVLNNCADLSESKRSVTISGRIFMPEFVIYGADDWRGLNLTDFVPDEPQILTAFLEIGEGPNTMDSYPEFFTEKDLVIRDADGQTIRHGYLISVTGKLRFNPDQPNGKCEFWVDSIQSQMPSEVGIPLETDIKPLLEQHTVGHGMQATVIKKCAELAYQKQFIRINVSVDFWNFPAECAMGICRIKIKDKTGSMYASFVQSESPNSMVINKDVWGPKSWKIFDYSGIEANKDKLILTGILYSDLDGCRLSVYSVESN